MPDLPHDNAAIRNDVPEGLPTTLLTGVRRLGIMILVVGAASLGLVGCGDDEGASDEPPPLLADEPNYDASERDLTGIGAAPQLKFRLTDDDRFGPSRVRVGVASTVQLTIENEGSAEHTFTMEELDIDETIEPGGIVSLDVSFPETGTYEFVCRIHGDEGMRGEFVVEESDLDPRSTTTDLTDGTGDPGSGSEPEGGTVPLDPGGLDGEGAGTDADNEDSSAGGVGSNN